jgi:cell division protease FtsH
MNNQPPQDQNQGGPPQRPAGLSNTWKIIGIIFVISLLFPWISTFFFGGPNTISYTDFKQDIKDGSIKKITMKGEEVHGVIQQASGGKGEQNFVTYLPAYNDPELAGLLKDANVEVYTESSQGTPWIAILINFLPLILIFGFFYYSYRRMQGQNNQIFGVGRSRAKLYERQKVNTTFKDVGGIDQVKDELVEIISYLKNPRQYSKIGARAPKGVLLVGPPGTGKTLLARAVAGEANVPFFSVTGSDFMEMFVGVGASRVRSLFADAKRSTPSIIFIDELDSIGRHRGAGLGGGHDEREQTLNQLLSEMDGFEPNEGVVIIAATNRPDILDPALLRPGRFDRRISVDLPTLSERQAILALHAQNKPLQKNVSLKEIAQGTPGFSGADLFNLLNEAALLAARKKKDTIGPDEMSEARDKIIMGLERTNLVLTDEDKKIIAFHEAGHTLLAAMLPNADPIHKVSLIPRSMSLGVTQQLPEKDRYIFAREYLMDKLTVMMGGRVAEELIFSTVTSGAENDLREATKIARRMVLQWGMGQGMNNISLGDEHQHIFLGEEIGRPREYSEETARQVDAGIKAILDGVYKKARDIISTNNDKLEKIAKALLKKEVLTGKEVKKIIASPVAAKN